MKMRLKRIILKDKDISLVAILYCICILSATVARWMNYANALAIAVMLIHFVRTKRMTKSALNIMWSAFIAIYPLADAFIRGEVGLSLFVALCYITPMLFILIGDIQYLEFCKNLFLFTKLFAWFQVLGIFLQAVIGGLYTSIAWRLFGYWSSGRTGFAPDATFAAYIICFATGVYFIELAIVKTQTGKILWKNLIAAIVLFGMMVATGKRSSLIICLIALMVVFFARASLYSSRLIKTVVSCVGVLVVALIVIMISYYSGADNAFGRFGATLIGVANGEDVTNMRSTWVEYMNEWRQGHELIGIGWKSFSNRIMQTPYGGKVPNGHNVYLQILCEEGYIGLVLYVILMLYTIITAILNVVFYSDKKDEKMLLNAMVGLYIAVVCGIYCYFGNAIYDAVIYFYFFAAVQMISIAQMLRRKYEHRMKRG